LDLDDEDFEREVMGEQMKQFQDEPIHFGEDDELLKSGSSPMRSSEQELDLKKKYDEVFAGSGKNRYDEEDDLIDVEGGDLSGSDESDGFIASNSPIKDDSDEI